jgi:hypothetical protein
MTTTFVITVKSSKITAKANACTSVAQAVSLFAGYRHGGSSYDACWKSSPSSSYNGIAIKTARAFSALSSNPYWKQAIASWLISKIEG